MARAVELFPADCVVAIVPVGKVGVPVNGGFAGSQQVEVGAVQDQCGFVHVLRSHSKLLTVF